MIGGEKVSENLASGYMNVAWRALRASEEEIEACNNNKVQ